ncbi:MAG: hypothetical protein N2B01_01870 [Psychrobacter cryohalolentis]
MSYMQLKVAFENITKSVWNVLGDAFEHDLSFGETSISDMILLYLIKLNNPNISIKQTKQNEEADFGTDWVWWIGSDDKGWVAFAVQAKKYSTKNDRYNLLAHKVKGISQSDILKSYSDSIQAVPIYALYNHVLRKNFSTGITGLIFNYPENMYGVTLASLNVIKEATNTRGCRNFKFIHDKLSTITLPDLICETETYLANYANNKNKIHLFEVYPKVHSDILTNELIKTKTFVVNSKRDEVQIKVYAKRQLIINIDNDDRPIN